MSLFTPIAHVPLFSCSWQIFRTKWEISISDNYLLKALENIADEETDVVIMFSVD